jgi:hypothetical protein
MRLSELQGRTASVVARAQYAAERVPSGLVSGAQVTPWPAAPTRGYDTAPSLPHKDLTRQHSCPVLLLLMPPPPPLPPLPPLLLLPARPPPPLPPAAWGHLARVRREGADAGELTAALRRPLRLEPLPRAPSLSRREHYCGGCFGAA